MGELQVCRDTNYKLLFLFDFILEIHDLDVERLPDRGDFRRPNTGWRNGQAAINPVHG